ncbi:hypothetical protein DM992_22805 [Burkholderia sp. JP2-270]|uniref:hypothetical protein n=1 Tax=Burkholderia sp. JP2-270 TaxID=2217913 RepID=UPI000DA3AC1D|nr:hypothetical protein [Burkholderia sp. JP2-270]AWV02274.1 hypothetical protein DM992_22805 [Burkholderia sp. JP2-270]
MIEWSKQAWAAELKRFRVNGNVWIAADEMRTGVADRLPAVAQFFRSTLMRPAVFEREGGDTVLLYPCSIACDES